MTDIFTRRRLPPPANRACPECGEEWWHIAVAVSGSSIVGRGTILKCSRCGHAEEL